MFYRELVLEVDGELVIRKPSFELLDAMKSKGVDPEALIADWAFKHPGSVLLKPTETSRDKTFRNAWKLKADKSGIETDLVKAKVIAHDKRRERRAKLLEPLDRLATSPNSSIKNKAIADKQVILDADVPVQSAIDAAATEAELKQILVDYQAI